MTATRIAIIVRSLGLAILAACVLGAGACGGSSSSSPASPSSSTPYAASFQYVSVTGDFLIGAAGGSAQLRAMVNKQSGPQDVTSQATWTSSNDAIATVSPNGLVSAKGPGLAVITASYQGFSGHGGVSVATAVNVTGTWRGTSTNPTSYITLELTQAGASVSGSSTTIGGTVTYTGSLTGTLNGGTVVLSGSVSGPSGPYASWSDERCALENANSMRCVNPMTHATGSTSLLEVTLVR